MLPRSVDKLLTHDVCGPGTFGIFQKEFGMDAQVGGRGSAGGSGCEAVLVAADEGGAGKAGDGAETAAEQLPRVQRQAGGCRGTDARPRRGAGMWVAA